MFLYDIVDVLHCEIDRKQSQLNREYKYCDTVGNIFRGNTKDGYKNDKITPSVRDHN